MRFIVGLVALALLAGCGTARQPMAAAPAPLALAAQSQSRVSPEKALERATGKALDWQADARLVSVAWAVAKFELTSVVFHLFHSPSAGRLFLVESKLVSFWQETREITDKKFTLPAKVFATLTPTNVEAKEALAAAKAFLPPEQQRPIAVLALVKPVKFLPAVWAVKADAVKALIDANSGKVLVHTDRVFPLLPFELLTTGE